MKKAQAGLSILLSVLVSLFIIGLVVMIFALMSAGLRDSDSLYTSVSGTSLQETLTSVEDVSGEDFAVAGYRSASCNILNVTNASNLVLIASGNYTQTNCNLLSSGGNVFNNTNWNVSYTYSYLNPTQAVDIINETVVAASGVTTWFPIMIVITAMVVLILLTVIIITAIRGSGLVGNEGKGNNKRGGNIGTA